MNKQQYLMELFPPSPVAAGLFLGTFWLVVVLLAGAILLHIASRRLDP